MSIIRVHVDYPSSFRQIQERQPESSELPTAISIRDTLIGIDQGLTDEQWNLLASQSLELCRSPLWEAKAAGFACCRQMLASCNAADEITVAMCSDEYCDSVVDIAKLELEHKEPRVRNVVAEVLGELASRRGISVYLNIREQLMGSIIANFEREGIEPEEKGAEGEAEAVSTEAVAVAVDASAAADTNFAAAEVADEKADAATEADAEFPPAEPMAAAVAMVTAAAAAGKAAAAAAAAAGSAGDGAEGEHAGHDHGEERKLALIKMAGKPVIAHDTVGWKALESNFRGLRSLMRGCGSEFMTGGHLTPELLALIVRACVEHINRFVRETAMGILDTVAAIAPPQLLNGEPLASTITATLQHGLADNWSQVRYASSVATRSFLLKGGQLLRRFYPQLVPCMCLNRYYVAEGVRLYSQATWAQVMGEEGRAIVAAPDVLPCIVQFYIEQAQADNHAVREAACHCTAELATKVDTTAVAPHVPQLLQVLVDCFKDESWPVRDAACVATGRFVAAFAEESRGQLEELYALWFAHLSDNIWSVRADSAVALGYVIDAYGEEALARITAKMAELLPRAKDQPADSKRYAGLESKTQFGVAAIKKMRDNDADLHTGNQVFSCGSLAPKLRRGGGCMDHGFTRPQEPWESSDGALYLLAEIAKRQPTIAAEQLPLVAELAGLTQFTHAPALHETVWKQLPVIATALCAVPRTGKRAFKRALDPFLEPLVRSLSQSDHRLSAHAAGQAVAAIARLIGPAILRGRLEGGMGGPAWLEAVQNSPFVTIQL